MNDKIKEEKPEEQPEKIDLAEIVKESKENLAQADGEGPPIKRSGRGRPKKKDGDLKNPTGAPPSSPVSIKPILETIVAMPPQVMASSTGFAGFALSQPEKDMLSTQADVVAQTYMPEVSSNPNATLYLFIASYSFILIGKYLEYFKWKKEMEDENERRIASKNTLPLRADR